MSSVLGGILGPVEVVEGIAVGTGVGGAIADVVTPRLEKLRVDQWRQHPDVPLSPGEAATAAVKGYATQLDPANEAAGSGVGGDQFAAMVENRYTYPGAAELIGLVRRAFLSAADADAALERNGVTPTYRAALAKLVNEILSPQEVALGVVRSLIADPGLMPVNLDTSGGVVPAYPQSDIEALTEAGYSGIDRERLRVMVGEIGLPMSTQQAASAYFRGIIELGDYNRSILEGDVRPEWAASILEQARQILLPHEYVEARLRAWIDDAAMYAGTAKHGMSKADTDLLLKVTGRPMTAKQVFVALRRGGIYNGAIDQLDPAFLKSLQESNVRPEWYNLEWADRETYPSAFVTRALAQAGEIDHAETLQILLFEGWNEALADKVATSWTGGAGAVSDPHVKKAQTTLFTEAHKQYVKGGIGTAAVTPAFEALAIPAAAQTEILALWDVERTIQADPAIE